MTKALRSQTNYHAGLAAEAIVARNYTKRGAQISHERWRGSAGEIDLILRENGCVVFVEIKKSRTHDSALARVSSRQMTRICNAASIFLANEPNGQNTDIRFDVATVDASGSVRIIENAFMAA